MPIRNDMDRNQNRFEQTIGPKQLNYHLVDDCKVVIDFYVENRKVGSEMNNDIQHIYICIGFSFGDAWLSQYNSLLPFPFPVMGKFLVQLKSSIEIAYHAEFNDVYSNLIRQPCFMCQTLFYKLVGKGIFA